MALLEEILEEMNAKFELQNAKHEIVVGERDRLQKIVDELQWSKEECFSIAAMCCEKLQNTFVTIGVFSSEKEFVHGDTS
jgi:hypothetical protein